ncbi:hypothetical protein BJF79_46590 [Actinomadura sp. CNU-125]|nr:hypothetical protein BJF79_46590 [Actinomadura sp. CNU-125]
MPGGVQRLPLLALAAGRLLFQVAAQRPRSSALSLAAVPARHSTMSAAPPGSPRRNQPRTPTACATDTASAVLITACGLSRERPSSVVPERSSRNVVTRTSRTSRRGGAWTPLRSSSRAASASTRSSSTAKSAIGNTVSKLNRRFSAALISLTPRSRVLAVAITLKPSRANTIASGPVSSGIAMTRSDSGESSESCTSRGQRVISSNRTTRPSAIPCSSGAGTSDRVEGPSDTSSA